MSFEAIEEEFIDSLFNKTSDYIWGTGDEVKSEDEIVPWVGTTEDPLFQDTFFHPDLIEDDQICKAVLHAQVGKSGLRIWDVALLAPNVAFLLFLFYKHPKTRSRFLSQPSQGLKTYYSFALTLSLTAALRSFLAILLNFSSPNHDVTDAVIREVGATLFLSVELIIGVLLVAENKARAYWRWLTCSCCLLSLLVTVLQLYKEITAPYYGLRLFRTNYQLWGEGGPVFSAALAGSLTLLTLLLLLLSSPPVSQLLSVPPVTSRRILYLTALTVCHSVSCLGSTLLFYHVNFGLCLSKLSTLLYYTAYPLLIYTCFLNSKLPSLKNYQFSYSVQNDEEDHDGNNTDCSSIQTFVLDRENSQAS